MNTRILLIGFGNMGQALARGWLAKGRGAATIRIVEGEPDALANASKLGLVARPAVAAAVDGFRPEVVLLAVKPNQLGSVLEQSRAITGGPVFLSIAAGKTLTQIEQGLGARAAVVRAMPNTPAAIGRGMSVLVANPSTSTAQRAECGELLAAVGETAWVDDERQMDAVTALSGSGPAYVFLLIECLTQAGVELGLGAELAKQLALATVGGAGAYAAAATEPPAELRRRVTSPGGTTQAALAVLMGEQGLQDLIGRALRAAADRSRELSQV